MNFECCYRNHDYFHLNIGNLNFGVMNYGKRTMIHWFHHSHLELMEWGPHHCPVSHLTEGWATEVSSRSSSGRARQFSDWLIGMIRLRFDTSHDLCVVSLSTFVKLRWLLRVETPCPICTLGQPICDSFNAIYLPVIYYISDSASVLAGKNLRIKL